MVPFLPLGFSLPLSDTFLSVFMSNRDVSPFFFSPQVLVTSESFRGLVLRK